MFQADLFGSGLPSASPVSFVFKPKGLASVPHDIEDIISARCFLLPWSRRN